MPTVAVLAGRFPDTRHSLHRGYADALWRAGATPLILVPPASAEGVRAYVSAATSCDAVCITGGGDVDPSRYGKAPAAALMDLDPWRDEAEIACVRTAVAHGLAVLGICRGIQVVAVALGGTLVQDLPAAGFGGHWDEKLAHSPVHPVSADPGSLAAAALGGTTTVNSIHHQAVAQPGPSLAATARAADGVIEAVEAPGVLGIQWHPERLLVGDERHLAPFRWVTAQAEQSAA